MKTCRRRKIEIEIEIKKGREREKTSKKARKKHTRCTGRFTQIAGSKATRGGVEQREEAKQTDPATKNSKEAIRKEKNNEKGKRRTKANKNLGLNLKGRMRSKGKWKKGKRKERKGKKGQKGTKRDKKDKKDKKGGGDS